MIWLFITIILGALGQLFFKIASVQEKGNESLINFYISLATNYHTWLGTFCYGITFFIWFRVLTRFDLSYARPFISIGFIVTAVLSMLILQEKITPLRWVGIILITIGSVLLGLPKEMQ